MLPDGLPSSRNGGSPERGISADRTDFDGEFPSSGGNRTPLSEGRDENVTPISEE
jgi:hypothetical protein